MNVSAVTHNYHREIHTQWSCLVRKT